MDISFRQRKTVTIEGFTLIELMIVVAVVAILTAIALPSYSQYVQRGHRNDARAGLLQAQQYLERAATANGTYPTTLPPAFDWTNDASKRYIISLGGPATPTAFTLSATPKTPGPQASDPCGVLTVSNAGVKGANGLLQTAAGYDANCWLR